LIDDDYDLVSRCLKKEVVAEYKLYERFAPRMNGVCLRYGGNEMEAGEILQIGFIRLFSHLHQFRFEGRFEGWVRRIFVTSAINYYKKNLKFRQDVELTAIDEDASLQEDALSRISTKELLAIIQSLPVGYRTIFNMYVIENYQHNEIADMLGISEGTSKSQLSRAKTAVRQMLKEREQ
jgi:RNA polymerase sigma factor (sigma-70 family)